LDAFIAQQLVGAAGGEDFHALGDELAREFEDAGLVRNADQRAANGKAGGLVGHVGVHEGR